MRSAQANIPSHRQHQLLVCLALIALLSPVAAWGVPAIYSLGTLGADSYGYAVNASGQVAGYSDPNPTYYHAFIYDGTPGSDGMMRDLGTLGGYYSYAYGINASGQIAGYSYLASGTEHAIRYDRTAGHAGTMFDLGTLPGGLYSYGNAINSSGQVVGESDTGGGVHAFIYSGTPGSGGAMVDIGPLVPNMDSYAYGINDSTQVTGYGHIVFNGAFHAFLYNKSSTPGKTGTMIDLGTLPGDTVSLGFAINASGQIAGSSGTGTGIAHAFLYTGVPGNGGRMSDLGVLAGGKYSLGFGINTSGQIVGTSDTAAGIEHAILYVGTPGIDGHLIDLDRWLDVNNPTEGAKWTLNEAKSISDNGLITGYGTYTAGGSSGTRAFLLDASSLIPEPASLSVLSLVGLTILRPRKCLSREHPHAST